MLLPHYFMKPYTLYRIKEGKRQVWLDWCSEIMASHYDEGAETLQEEDLLREMCIIFGDAESYCLYIHTPLPGQAKKPATERDLNKKHFEKMDECLERIRPKVIGYDIFAKGVDPEKFV